MSIVHKAVRAVARSTTGAPRPPGHLLDFTDLAPASGRRDWQRPMKIPTSSGRSPGVDIPPHPLPDARPAAPGTPVDGAWIDVAPEPMERVDPWLLFGVVLFGMVMLMIVFRRRRGGPGQGA